MAFVLDASINVLWQNLIALNGSLIRENEDRRAELLQTKEQLQKEINKSRILQEQNESQQEKIAKLSSKLTSVRRIVSFDPDDDPTADITGTDLPVIVKVESAASVNGNTSTVVVPPNLCIECDKKFCSPASLRRHKNAIHLNVKYPCPKCSKIFSRRENVKHHIEEAHRGEQRTTTNVSTRSASGVRANRSNAQ